MFIVRLSTFWLLGSMCVVTPTCDAFAQVLAADDKCADAHTRDRFQTTDRDSRRDDVRHDQVLEGLLSWVADGDSIWVLVNSREVEVRLADIDAPERDQAYAWEAKLGLIDLLRGRHLKLLQRDVDRHGRIVARVWSGDLDVSRELIRRGLAWFYPTYGRDSSLRCEERQARSEARGLWAGPTPQAPWVHRREMDHRERRR